MVKLIDIDLERRRISLSLKQANEGVDIAADDFDPSLRHDRQLRRAGQLHLPEGFDPELRSGSPATGQLAWEASTRRPSPAGWRTSAVEEAEAADTQAAVAR